MKFAYNIYNTHICAMLSVASNKIIRHWSSLKKNLMIPVKKKEVFVVLYACDFAFPKKKKKGNKNKPKYPNYFG